MNGIVLGKNHCKYTLLSEVKIESILYVSFSISQQETIKTQIFLP